jgi:hypothetical protein
MTHDYRVRTTARVLVVLTCLVVAGVYWPAMPGKSLVTVLFSLVVPGWCLAATIGFPSVLMEWLTALASSIAIGTLLAVGMVLVQSWHPEVAGTLVVGVTLLGLIRLAVIGVDTPVEASRQELLDSSRTAT